jgi:L-ribulose-5-phosphate 3-epimerase
MNRREYIHALVATGAAGGALAPHVRAGGAGWQFNCFTKPLQWLDYREAAEMLKAAGYDGADLTVRPGGHVEPERVEEDLPKAVEAFEAVGLKIPMMVSAVTRADDPLQEKTLRVAKKLGVKLYRMGYLKYDAKAGVEQSIDNLRPQVRELADLNREIGITGAYQNHAGTNIGGPVWDLRRLLKGIDPQHLGIQYDIKHATAEGGNSWSLGLKLVAEHINCLALKDFLWQKESSGKWRNNPVPMGTGMVDYASYFNEIKKLGIHVPITIHVEYKMPHELLKDKSPAELKKAELELYRYDLDASKAFMSKAGLL